MLTEKQAGIFSAIGQAAGNLSRVAAPAIKPLAQATASAPSAAMQNASRALGGVGAAAPQLAKPGISTLLQARRQIPLISKLPDPPGFISGPNSLMPARQLGGSQAATRLGQTLGFDGRYMPQQPGLGGAYTSATGYNPGVPATGVAMNFGHPSFSPAEINRHELLHGLTDAAVSNPQLRSSLGVIPRLAANSYAYGYQTKSPLALGTGRFLDELGAHWAGAKPGGLLQQMTRTGRYMMNPGYAQQAGRSADFMAHGVEPFSRDVIPAAGARIGALPHLAVAAGLPLGTAAGVGYGVHKLEEAMRPTPDQ